MDRCERLEICPMFNEVLPREPRREEELVKRYCRGDYGSCARLAAIDVLGPGHVPHDLYPDDKGGLWRLISSEPDARTGR